MHGVTKTLADVNQGVAQFDAFPAQIIHTCTKSYNLICHNSSLQVRQINFFYLATKSKSSSQ